MKEKLMKEIQQAMNGKLRFSPELDNILLKDWCKSL